MATSTMTAPSFTMSGVIRPVLPTAHTRISARRHSSARSGVREWQMVTVASFCSISRAWGFPTMLERPKTTQCFPAGSTPPSASSSMTPAGVQGKKQGSPVISLPTFMGWKPSTSLSGSIASSTAFSSNWGGRGSCTRMPSISARPLSTSISSSSCAGSVSAGRAYSSL